MALKKYSREEIEKFLKAVDVHLSGPMETTLIGGAAAALAFQVESLTKDIDTATNVTQIQHAIEAARRETKLNIPMEQVGVMDAPYDYEERLKDLPEYKFKMLKLKVPEVHDYILIKATRGNESDLEMIEEVSKNMPIDLDILLKRIQMEMGHVIGNPEHLRLNYLATIERIFGSVAAENAERKLKGFRSA